MSTQTMNIHCVVSVTVARPEQFIRADGTAYYIQLFRFATSDDHSFDVTTFSDAPSVLKLAGE